MGQRDLAQRLVDADGEAVPGARLHAAAAHSRMGECSHDEDQHPTRTGPLLAASRA